jgi:hypothetical protein
MEIKIANALQASSNVVVENEQVKFTWGID